ncbi:MAG: hypothetical protein JNK73_07050 [Bacteroidia bacterium]|nr:hypothetical protein [Bacteroidia bacterium]
MKKRLIIVGLIGLNLSSYCQQLWNTNGQDIYNTNPGGISIGHTQPSYRLDILCGQQNDGIIIAQPTANGNSGIVFSNLTTNLGWSWWNLGANHGWGGDNFCLFDGNPNMNYPSLFFKRSNSNVGIATANPLARLQVNVNPAVELRGFVVRNSATNVESFIVHADGTTGIHCAAQPVAGANGHSGHALVIVDALGAPNTWKKNFVVYRDGTVRAREIFVQASSITFPDYVFKKEYKLMPLSELESYIEENQHLPNIPSAVEVEKDGIGLGDLTKIQMEKIEELTLYILELNKEIENLKSLIGKKGR